MSHLPWKWSIKGFEFVINSASNPNDVPRKVVKFVCAKLKSDKNEIASWRLAGDGWRSELKKYRDGVITRYAGSLNSPRSGQVDDLFLYLTGLKRVSDSWTWQGMNAASAKKKLDSYISHRGEIVHRFKTTKDVTRGYVVEYIQFVLRLTVKTANRVRNHTHKITGQHPWKAARFRSVRWSATNKHPTRSSIAYWILINVSVSHQFK